MSCGRVGYKKMTLECQRQYQQNWREINRAKVRASSARWRANTPKEKQREIHNRSVAKHSLARKARQFVALALGFGIIEKPAHCERCPRSERLHAHHADPAQPLVIQWLCSECHGFIHRLIKSTNEERD